MVPQLQAAAAKEKYNIVPGSEQTTEDEHTAVPIEEERVNVERAKQKSEKVQRSYSRRSDLNRRLSRLGTKGEHQFDPETGGDHGEEFDLLDFLFR